MSGKLPWGAVSRIVEEDRPALPEIARAGGYDGGWIDAREHRFAGKGEGPDQRLAWVERKDQLCAFALARRPLDGHRILYADDTDVSGKRLPRLPEGTCRFPGVRTTQATTAIELSLQ